MDNKSVQSKERKVYLDLLRIISISAVLLMHSTGFFDNVVDAILPQWYIAIILGTVTRFAVPVFVMISGALMLNKDTIDIKRLYSKNIVRFAIAYLFWSFFYTIIYSFIPYYGSISIVSIKNLISGTLKGGYFHLWYMPLIIGLYVALPILHQCVRIMEEHQIRYWLVAGFLICFILPLVRKIPVVDHIWGESIDTFDGGFWGEYILYFILGYVLDRSMLSNKQCRPVYFAGIASALITVLLVLIPSIQTGTLIDVFRNNNTPNILVMSVSLFLFVKNGCFEKARQSRMLPVLSNLSFGVYLVHEFVLVELYSACFVNSKSVGAILILFVASMVISYAIIWMIRRLKRLSNYIT